MTEKNQPNIAVSLMHIHAIVTRGLDTARKACQDYSMNGEITPELREGFARYVYSLASVLHSHHLTEDDLAFPFLSAYIPDAPYARLADEHQQLVPLLKDLQVAGQRWKDGAPESLVELSVALDCIHELWQPHIRQEEEVFTPQKLAELIPVEEQLQKIKEFGQHSQTVSGPDYLVVPFMLFNLGPEERLEFGAAMPPVVTQELVPNVWKEHWAPMKPFLLD